MHADASVGIASNIQCKCWSLPTHAFGQGCNKAGNVDTTLTYQLQAVQNCLCLQVYELRQARLGCVALAVAFSGFHSCHRLICCTDRTVMLRSSLLWATWSSLDCLLLATVIEVSVSRLYL